MSTAGHRRRQDEATIDALLARPQGLSCAELMQALPGISRPTASKRLGHRVDVGEAFMAKAPGTITGRWFCCERDRDAWAAMQPAYESRDERLARRRAERGPTLRMRIAAALAEHGSRGVRATEMATALGARITAVAGLLCHMIECGQAQAVIYRNMRIITAAGVPLADDALLAHKMGIDAGMARRGQRKGSKGRAGNAVIKARPALPAGVTLAPRRGWCTQEPINAGQVPVTVCPAPRFDHRYQVDPAQRVPGGLAALGPGRYDMPPSAAVASLLGGAA